MSVFTAETIEEYAKRAYTSRPVDGLLVNFNTRGNPDYSRTAGCLNDILDQLEKGDENNLGFYISLASKKTLLPLELSNSSLKGWMRQINLTFCRLQ